MIFRRKPPPEVTLTNESFGRWLRAGRPQPITWFLAIDEDAQEQLAILGDEYQQDVCVGIGYAVADPQLADAGLDAADSVESEEVLVRRAAADLAANIFRGSMGQQQPLSPAKTTNGTTEPTPPSFLGQAPDAKGGP